MKKLLPMFLVLLMLFTGCGQEKKTTDTVFAMDTVMTLTAYDSEAEANMVLSECKKEIYRLEDMLSTTDPESDIARFNGGDSDALSGESRSLLQEALFYAEATGGAFDPTLYALTDVWGFYNDDYSVPTETELQEALSRTGYKNATLTTGTTLLPEGMGVDLGGIAKGYAAEKVLETMSTNDVDAAVISLGGNVGLLGTKPDGSDWIVAVEKPDGSGETIATLSIPGAKETYVVTSGAYQRYFEADGVRYHHILDPETGFPAETDLLSVTIICESGVKADALSTALFVMGFEEAVEYWRGCRNDTDPFDVVLITEDGIFASEGLHITAQVPVTTLEVAP